MLPAGLSPCDLPELPIQSVGQDDEYVLIKTMQGVLATNRLTAWALERDLDLEHFSVTQPTLEDIYLELTEPGTTTAEPDSEAVERDIGEMVH